MKYGRKLSPGPWRQRLDSIGDVEVSKGGNIIIPVYTTDTSLDEGSQKIAHIVLTPQEANRLSSALARAIGKSVQ